MLVEDEVRALFATLPDGLYRLTNANYDVPFGPKGSSIVEIRRGKLRARYESLWCGSGVEGETFRSHKNGRQAPYSAPCWTASDLTARWSRLLDNYPDLRTDDILPRV